MFCEVLVSSWWRRKTSFDPVRSIKDVGAIYMNMTEAMGFHESSGKRNFKKRYFSLMFVVFAAWYLKA